MVDVGDMELAAGNSGGAATPWALMRAGLQWDRRAGERVALGQSGVPGRAAGL